MAGSARTPAPPDAAERRNAKPIVAYPVEGLPPFDAAFYDAARAGMTKVDEDHRPAARGPGLYGARGPFLPYRLHRGPTSRRPQSMEPVRPVRALLQRQDARAPCDPCQHRRPAVEHAAFLRPMATIAHDTLAWYGFDEDGAGVHDVIGTRCDPYTNLLLTGVEYHHCCHSNLAARSRRSGTSRRWRPSPTSTTCSTSSCAPASRATRISTS